jgi:hypothetical protein
MASLAPPKYLLRGPVIYVVKMVIKYYEHRHCCIRRNCSILIVEDPA